MKKRDKKLQLHRDTLRSLDPLEQVKVVGAGPHSSENRSCCGDVDPFTRPVKEKNFNF